MIDDIGGDTDRYLWLEDVHGDRALAWVTEHNRATFDGLAGAGRYDELREDFLGILNADDRIPYVGRRAGFLYNFWRDADHPRGLWRRTTLESYRTPEPAWVVLLDVDALAEAEGENWVWEGARGLFPDFDRFLICLSRGGADAFTVREWDLPTRQFVPGGFTLPEAKHTISWIDADTVYVGTDLGPGSMTESGYPRIAKRWRRGTAVEQAETVFEGKPGDVSAHAYCDPTPGYERHFVRRKPDFITSELYLRTADGTYARIDVPDDARVGVEREWLLIRLRSPWHVDGTEYAAGSLLAARFDAYRAGDRALIVLFAPDEHTSLRSWNWTRNHLILTTLTDVTTRLHVLTPADGWRSRPLAGAPQFGEAAVTGTDPTHGGDEFFLRSESFTEPPTLRWGVIGGQVEVLCQAPARFDAAGVCVNQHFAASADGTQVPYFVVGRAADGPVPVLMTGYGGFEISMTPSYSGIIGSGWLERGGTYVVANIRGGGEYGPTWHQAAMRERRPRAYEDFAAVARDLVARGITTTAQMGIQGGSNGGLLMGVMLTTYPELFAAVVCQVPLLDMRRYHRLLAGTSWMAEWGDPDDPADWSYLRGYSPYHLLHADRRYPPTLMITSTRDDRVHPGHARKMTALMLEHGYDVQYYENIEGGHSAAADNEQAAVKWALILEFFWRRLAR